MVNQKIVLYPAPGIGHLISMVELGKLITKHHPSFTITVLIITPPYITGSTAPYIDRVSKTNPEITFHYLPPIPLSAIPTVNSKIRETIAFELLLLNNQHIHQALLTITASSTISAFIIDFFCSPSLELAQQLNIPVYCFMTSGISFLSTFLYLPTVDKNTTHNFKDMNNTFIDFPGVPTIRTSDMLLPVIDRNDKANKWFVYSANQFPKSRGIIVNSFDSLEPRALKAITDGLCVPDAPTPPIYPIGPLIASEDPSDGDGDRETTCFEWLDFQPNRSVVFLCFGSLGLFNEAQLKEIAIGLEKCGHRFLWVVRSPPNSVHTAIGISATLEPDLDALLPQGFIQRTKERGLVLKSWAPQVQVLSKESVGGFVTHCGWNSVLEGVCAGIPMVAWPLYAEQRINRVVMVKELKLALWMEEDENGFVRAEEVEKKVRGMMESEEGGVIRDRIVKLSGEAKEAISEGGSSVKALADLAELWER